MKRNGLKAMGLILTCVFLSFNLANAQTIPSPEQFFGFRMGTDGEIARWEKIVEYFQLLDESSDRLIVQNLGESTLGNLFILAIFSSSENLQSLDMYKEINKKLADPRGLSESEIEELIKRGKYVSAMTHSLHATEIGGTQGTPELAYELVTSKDPDVLMILDNTIFLMFPSFNPDGLIMVSDWFYKYKNTKYNNTRLPFLYHFYTGHDNNRDSYQLTQRESQLFARIAYREWIPQSFVDHHHMGSSGARFYIPPYLDPIHPNVDPLVWREHQLYGSHMAVALEQAGKSGFETGAPYTGWWQASFHMSTNYHNIAGMLTESASANWADPIFILPDQLRGTRGRPEYKPQMTMPRLWNGGWWRLRDIVEQQIISSKAVLELGARYRETLLRNMVRKAKGNIMRGQNEPPYAYILPKDQRDFLTAVKLARIFQMNGVEIHRLDKPYKVGTKVFAPGSFVISCAQPMRAFVVSFLEQVNYPDNTWTRSHNTQDPIRPYDLTAYSMSEHMGVDAIPILEPLRGIFMNKIEEKILPPKGVVEGEGEKGFVLEHTSNESFRALNRILEKDAKVLWAKEPFLNDGKLFPPGAMVIRDGIRLQPVLQEIAEELGLNFMALDEEISGGALSLQRPRIGLYKRYAGGNMDEGWTNWLLKEFEFSFSSLFNKDVKDSQFHQKFDVIILPSDSYARIKDGASGDSVPQEYRGGIGDAGVQNIKEFVQKGGTLVTLNRSAEFAGQAFNLPIQDISSELERKEFYCPGSILNFSVDTHHPLGYGMSGDILGLYRQSPILRVRAGTFEERVSIPVRYYRENILQSGWLIGEKHLSEKPAVVEFRVGEGKVIILAFPVQHRAQTHGTFKLLFNAIFYGSAEEVMFD